MMVPRAKSAPGGFGFRGIRPDILVGTASDRYAGWIGQIYSADRYDGRIIERKHTAGGNAPLSARELVQKFPSLQL